MMQNIKYSNLFRHSRRHRPMPTISCFLRYLHNTPKRSSAKLLDGALVARNIRLELKAEVQKWVDAGKRPPKLVALLVGNDPASLIYVKNKMRAAKEIGIVSIEKNFSSSISQLDLIKQIEILNVDHEVDGILIQLPLPPHIIVRDINNAVTPDKDVDGFNIVNVGRLCLNMEAFIPCTVLGVRELIKAFGIDTRGKNAVVCGRSKNVGMPMAMLLHSDSGKYQGENFAMDATTTICHRNTPPARLKEFTKNADIVISAAGVPNLITIDMVKPGSCVIDIGINRVIDTNTGKNTVVGDVDFDSVRKVAGFITPVPGGVGPMTVAMLMRNTIKAAKRSTHLHELDVEQAISAPS